MLLDFAEMWGKFSTVESGRRPPVAQSLDLCSYQVLPPGHEIVSEDFLYETHNSHTESGALGCMAHSTINCYNGLGENPESES